MDCCALCSCNYGRRAVSICSGKFVYKLPLWLFKIVKNAIEQYRKAVLLSHQNHSFVTHQDLSVDLQALVALIASIQKEDGEIPWWHGGKTDPWDHVEAAMGLTIGGRWHLARRAFKWLQEKQLPHGGWYAAYQNGVVADHTQETHHAAYLAVGLYHYYLITGDHTFVADMWPTLDAAVKFAIRWQVPGGEIYWALDADGKCDPMALLAGCSSISMSLKCALALARVLGRARPEWRRALILLNAAIEHKPHHFNMTKSRFSMDWFYPILSGAIQGPAAQKRLDAYWKKFVIQGMGVRCVSDQPWVTIAESCELVLSLAAMGHRSLARIVFGWICDHTFEDNTFWCGFTCPDMVLWPEEKISWTNAVALLAFDALYELTPASRLFSHQYWDDFDY